MLKNLFNVALSILFPPPPTTSTFDVALQVCVCVCVCVWLFLSFCFLFNLSYWLSYFCLVTIVLFCQSCLQNVKQKQNLSLLLFSFFFSFYPPCYYYYYCMQRLKESCNFLASVPGLPCTQKWKRKKGKKTRNKFFRSKYNSKLSI